MEYEDIIKVLELLYNAGKHRGVWELVVEYKVRKRRISDMLEERVYDFETYSKDTIPEDAFDITYILRDGSDGYIEMEISEEQYNLLTEFLNMQEEAVYFFKEKVEDLKALDAILKHTTCDGWSNGYSTKYYEMNTEELKIINKVYKNYKENVK